MPSQKFPTLNGIAPSWADIAVTLDATGAPLISMEDITAINTSAPVTVGTTEVGGRVMKTTTGEVKPEASFTVYREAFDDMLLVIEPLCPRRGDLAIYSLVHFSMLIQFTPPGTDRIFEQLIKGCRIIGDTENFAKGTEPNTVEVPLHIKEIERIVSGKRFVIL